MCGSEQAIETNFNTFQTSAPVSNCVAEKEVRPRKLIHYTSVWSRVIFRDIASKLETVLRRNRHLFHEKAGFVRFDKYVFFAAQKCSNSALC